MTSNPQSFYFGISQPCGQHVENGYIWQCTLCDRSLREIDLTKHIFEAIHQKHVSHIAMGEICVSSSLNRRTTIVPLESRLTKLEDTKWQFHVKALLYDFLSTGDYRIPYKAENLLRLYEHMGRLSLLELAVWKAASISHAGQVEVDSKMSMKTVHDAILCAAKHQHTWKKYRPETRKSNAIEIIMKHVLPFLGKP
jgi:hypothetical protein